MGQDMCAGNRSKSEENEENLKQFKTGLAGRLKMKRRSKKADLHLVSSSDVNLDHSENSGEASTVVATERRNIALFREDFQVKFQDASKLIMVDSRCEEAQEMLYGLIQDSKFFASQNQLTIMERKEIETLEARCYGNIALGFDKQCNFRKAVSVIIRKNENRSSLPPPFVRLTNKNTFFHDLIHAHLRSNHTSNALIMLPFLMPACLVTSLGILPSRTLTVATQTHR